MMTTRTVKARKPHRCSRCRAGIPAGALYLVHPIESKEH